MFVPGSLEQHQERAAVALMIGPNANALIGQTVAGIDHLAALADRLARTRDPATTAEIAGQAGGIRRTALTAGAALVRESAGYG